MFIPFSLVRNIGPGLEATGVGVRCVGVGRVAGAVGGVLAA